MSASADGSPDKVNDSSEIKTASDGSTEPRLDASIEADLAELTDLLSKGTLDEAGEANLAELLSRLESANGVAKGVESKLDSLIGNLDSLLESLEGEFAAQQDSKTKETKTD
ncbi:unnamed protein product [Mycena citricolor]|uniref:Uncharacterized protein n=1 Tax=Mycena citricolor TaxID=2018698 RepID=A0AAD2JW45_9AGAR|nr:unnamed protein product [Mycena citricolor]